ncbi:hypothetical protein OBBRIDRAFT_765235 [Obba rivulosa]|uniref:Uncharacterized protein n=1 Tax=Obba rivulosa TaxID=1052685 RepID=A0A8E2J7C1_9APHY|nr:hypothetical protein OBBRIDRAFT_765235 [Obba rivulosa]
MASNVQASGPSTIESSSGPSSSANRSIPKGGVFFRVLTAVPKPISSPPPIQSRPRVSQGRGRSSRLPDVPNAGEGACGVNETQRAASALSFVDIPEHQAHQQLYKPHGPWAWADGVTVEDTQTILDLESSGPGFTTALKRGYWNNHSLIYVSKAWSLAKRRDWRGFYSELAMYKSMVYLRAFQGLVIPPLLAVNVTADSVSLAMQLPHPCFWIEAHSTMPTVLKFRILEAYRMLHSHGVLHGSAELPHMLVGADAKVTLTDLHNSRSTIPNTELMVRGTTKDELEMEFRKVMYLLDFDGYKKDEEAKTKRHVDREERNSRRRVLREAAQRGDYIGPVEANEEPPPEDVAEPPVPEDILLEWRDLAGHQPRRFIVPTRTVKEVSDAAKSFLEIVHRMKRGLPLEEPPLTPQAWQQQQQQQPPPPHPATDQESQSLQQAQLSSQQAQTPSAQPHATQSERAETTLPPPPPPSRYNLRKRKSPSSQLTNTRGSPAKRPRAALPKGSARRPSAASSSQPVPAPPQVPVATVTDKLPIARSQSSNPPKPIKVRDFAFEPYTGAKGFYVPHPPTENRMYSERAVYIRRSNEDACLSQKLTYSHDYQGHPIPPDWKRKARRGSIQMGSLKRKRMERRDPDAIDGPAVLKKQRYLDSRAAGQDHDVGFLELEERMDVTEGPRILARAEYAVRPGPSTVSPARPIIGRSILKPTPPVKTFPYWGDGFTEPSDLTISPKLGPSNYIQVHGTEMRPFLDSLTDWRLPPAREDAADLDHLRSQLARSQSVSMDAQPDDDETFVYSAPDVAPTPRTPPTQDRAGGSTSSTRDPATDGSTSLNVSPVREHLVTWSQEHPTLDLESSDSEEEAFVEAMLYCGDEDETACVLRRSWPDDLHEMVRSWMRGFRGPPH